MSTIIHRTDPDTDYYYHDYYYYLLGANFRFRAIIINHDRKLGNFRGTSLETDLILSINRRIDLSTLSGTSSEKAETIGLLIYSVRRYAIRAVAGAVIHP